MSNNEIVLIRDIFLVAEKVLQKLIVAFVIFIIVFDYFWDARRHIEYKNIDKNLC